MDEFLYCYKPSEIKKSIGFYQFSSRGPNFSLIKGRCSSDRLWKTKFFIISGDWVGDPVDVNSAPFPPFTNPLGRLRPEGKYFFQKNSLFFFFLMVLLLLIRLILPSLFFALMQLSSVPIWTNFI